MSRFMCNINDLENHIGYYIAQEIFDIKGRLLVAINYEVDERIYESLLRNEVYCLMISEEKIEIKVLNSDSREAQTIENRKKNLRSVFNEVRDEVISRNKRSSKPSALLNMGVLKKVEKTIDLIIDLIMNNPFVAVNLIPLERYSQNLIRHSVNVCYLGLCLMASYKQIPNIMRDRKKGIGRFSEKKTSVLPSDLTSFGICCFLHDIGKLPMLDIIGSDERYEKDDSAWETIKTHSEIGRDMLFGKNINADVLLGIKYHHENFDGSGYPFGIEGYKIHPYSRIIRIIDSFDSGMENRPGREGKPFAEMLGEILALSGIIYDPELSDLFIDMMLCGKSGLIKKP